MENVDVNDIKVFRKLNATISDYFIAIQGLWVFNDKRLMIIAVYAPQEASEKRMLWEYLNHVIDNWNGEVVIMGDFNEVRSREERYGTTFNKQGADVFNSFISLGGLVDVLLEGCSFTWVHKSTSKMSKLDRFLISEGLIEARLNISAISLDRYLSDHRPILLREFYVDYGPVPFRFYHYWYELEGFDSFVEEVWKEQGYSNVNAFDAFMMKLRNLKAKIRIWIKARKEKSSIQKTKLKGMLTDIDLVIEANLDILNKRLHILKDIQLIEKLNTLEVAQKSKIKWAIEDMDFPNTLSLDQQDELESSISKDEFKRVVWDCGLDKSPGPDGFTFGFFRRYWNLLGGDLFDAVSYFFFHGSFPKGGNSSFIALIPKIQDAKMVKDFRPISLIGSLYKIIAKILANRLIVVLGDLVNEVQSAFVANRQILDGPFIVNELIQWCKSKKKQYMVFNVDFEKAYDSVRWDFLDDVLKKFGFGDRWRGWIQSCLSSSRGSILVNGSPTNEFQFYKGLKQGDPLSPFLFILVMKNDVVFMGHWSDSNISFIVQVLECFFHASGLRINMQKSKLIGIGVDDVKISKAGKSIGCLTFMTSFSYLGVKVEERFPAQVLNKLESIRSRFFNGADEKEKNYRGLAGKKNDNNSLRDKVMMAVQGNNGSIESLYRSSHSSTWLDIIQDFQQLKSKGMNLFNFIKKRIGNGEKLSFWKEVWKGDDTLKSMYPHLYALELSKNISVAHKLAQVDMDGSFRRPPKGDVELQQYTCFCSNLEDVILSNSQDRWLWSLTSSGEFSVASVKLDGLPTRFNLSRRGIDINSIICPCCAMAVETTSHLFFTCSMVRELYRKIAILWDIKLMEVDSFEGWTVWMSDIRLHGFRKEKIRFGEEFLKVFVAYDRRATGSRGVGDNVRSHGKYNESAHVGVMDGNRGTTFSRDNNRRFVDVVSGRNVSGVGINTRRHENGEAAHGTNGNTNTNGVEHLDGNMGRSNLHMGVQEKESCIEIEDNELNSELLGRSVTGEVKVMCFLTKLPSFCEEEGSGKVKIKLLGGLEVLVVLENEETMANVLKDKDHGIRRWIHTIRKGDTINRSAGRITWINILGIPISCWSEATFKKVTALHSTIMALHNCRIEGNQNMILGRVQIHTINKGLVKEDLNIKVKGNIHKISVVEEIRDITCWNIQEAVASENASKIGDEVGDKMGENDMIIDEEDDENGGEPNGEGESSDEEKDDEDGEGNEDEYGDGVPDMISGGWKHGEDEESKLSRELTVRENFEEMVVESNAKSAGPYEKIHGNYKKNEEWVSNRYGGSTVETVKKFVCGSSISLDKKDGICEKESHVENGNLQSDVPCVLLGHGMGPDSNEVLDHEDGLGTVNGANDCTVKEKIKDNTKKVGRRSVKKTLEVTRKIEVGGLGDNRKGVSDVYKEFYEVSSESNGIFQFGNNPRGETDSVKCNISMEHVKEVGELIGVSWIRTEEEAKTENMVKTWVADSNADGAMPQWLCMVCYFDLLIFYEDYFYKCKGFGGSGKRRWISNIIRHEHPDVIRLQETKCGVVDENWIEGLWGGKGFWFSQLPANGNSGAILLIWDTRVFTRKEASEDERFIGIKGSWIGTTEEVFLMCIYGPHVSRQKASLRDRISGMMYRWNGAWCIFRDLNVVRGNKDKLNLQVNSKEFINLWGNLSVVALERKLSDHCLIVLKDMEMDFGPKLFRVFNIWMEEKYFINEAKEAWKKDVRSVRPDCRF
ncbi:RNA-directed DNA polymerase, eukaryota, reverse transcriptase zinc-binding domain protein [Tanacetum coccineum]